MSRRSSHPEVEHRPFPFFGTIVGLIAAMNVTSAAAMLMAL